MLKKKRQWRLPKDGIWLSLSLDVVLVLRLALSEGVSRCVSLGPVFHVSAQLWSSSIFVCVSLC